MMKQMLRRVVLAALCLTLLMTPAALAASPTNVVDLLSRNTTLNLRQYEGKVILLNYFTEWCYYCMQEMPDIKEVNDMYDPEVLQVVMIHSWDGEDEKATANVKEKFGMDHMTFFEDQDRRVVAFSGLRGYPATVILKPDGTPAFAVNGMVHKEQLIKVLDELGVPRKAAEE